MVVVVPMVVRKLLIVPVWERRTGRGVWFRARFSVTMAPVDTPWTYVAMGDSLTEGVGDPMPDGSLRGWADMLGGWLAVAKPGSRYVNLAARGLTTSQVRERQIDDAIRLRPALVSFVSGMNDVLRPRFDAAAFEDHFDASVATLRAAGAAVLTSTFADTTGAMLAPRTVKATLSARLRQAGAIVRRVSERHGAICADCWDEPEVRETRVLSVDRLHPSPWGHRLIATRVAAVLNDHLGLGIDVPGERPSERLGAGAFDQARWLARNVPIKSMGEAVVRMVVKRPYR